MKKLNKYAALLLVFLLALALPVAALAGNQGKKNQLSQLPKNQQQNILGVTAGELDEENLSDENLNDEQTVIGKVYAQPQWKTYKPALKEDRKVVKAEWKEAKRQIKIMRHGQEVGSDVAPVIKNGRVLVPLRAIAAITGAEVKWDQASQTITITKAGQDGQADQIIIITIGISNVVVNGVDMTSDAVAELENNRTIVPLRFIAEALNLRATYEAETGTIEIGDDEDADLDDEADQIAESTTDEPAADGSDVDESAADPSPADEPAADQTIID